ncbi:unnamed protein product [Lathyrus oleraceus]
MSRMKLLLQPCFFPR